LIENFIYSFYVKCAECEGSVSISDYLFVTMIANVITVERNS